MTIYNANRAVRLFSSFSVSLRLLCKRLKSFLSFLFVSNAMETRVERLGYDVSFNPPGHGDFFYASAAQALGVETKDLKKVTFDFLKSH